MTIPRMKTLQFGIGLALCSLTAGAQAGFVIFEAAVPSPSALLPTVNAFRTALGTLNPNDGTHRDSGRREINWDGVPASFSDPNPFPGDFFNSSTIPGRARGATFTTPGTGFLVNANSFGFPSDFIPFSSPRLFTPVNSVITDVTFSVPGTDRPATVSGFGAVFSDVEIAGLTKLEFFDILGTSLFSRNVLVGGQGGQSFLGAIADAGERIARVRITTGDIRVQGNGSFSSGTDTVVLDDFLYSEPLPEPGTLALFGAGFAVSWRVRARRASLA